VIRIAANLFGTRVDDALPNLDYCPGLIYLRRCDSCVELDRRAWYTTPDQLTAHEARHPGKWSCLACASGSATTVRGWFDAVYG
jgi:hypothetical protein